MSSIKPPWELLDCCIVQSFVEAEIDVAPENDIDTWVVRSQYLPADLSRHSPIAAIKPC